jgi:predicted Zn-dependent protease
MNKLSVSRSVAVTLVVLVIPALLLASHSWGGYHWARTSNPFTLKVGNNLTADWGSAFSKSVQNWNNSTVLQLSPIAGTSNKRCSMVSGTVQVCNGKYGNNGWLGLASINLASGTNHITQGSAKMNDTYFSTPTYNNANERLHVMCQEIGHTFGLDHQDTSGASLNTCMDYFSNTGPNAASTLSTTPNAHDYDELVTIYAHLDSTTTIGARAAAVAGRSEVTNDPNTWGMLISQSANGRSSTYENVNNDGSKTVTHVYWTAEAADRCASCDHRYDR